MSLLVCIDCGAGRADPDGPCAECRASPPAWKPAPFSLARLGRRLGASGLCLGLFVACLWLFHVVGTHWLYPAWPLRPVKLGLGGLLLILGAFTGYLAVREIFRREHVHDEGGRLGKATMLFRHLLFGEGHADRLGERFVPETPSLEGVRVFAGMKTVHPALSAALRQASQPRAVDAAVLASLLGLAARGRIGLVLRTHRSWIKLADFAPPSRQENVQAVLVRACPGGPDLAPETGWLEHALLSTLETLSGSAPRAPRSAPLGPYRAGKSTPATDPPAAEPVLVEALLAELTGGRRDARGWLHGNLRAEARRAGSQREIEQARRLAQELAGVFGGVGEATARALLTQIQAGLAPEEAAPPA